MQLIGKKVLITGGARRVGAEIARAAAARGAIVLLHCHTSGAAGEMLLDTLPGSGHRLFVADFAQPGAAARLFVAAGAVDVLINNASVYARTSADLPEPEARRFFEINFWSPLALMRAFAAGNPPAGGAVVNVLDQEVFAPAPENGPYSWSRRALADATLDFARRYGARNLRFNAVAPGPMLPPVGMENSTMAKTLRSVPLGRRVEPADLAAAVFFAVENESLTGAVIPVDGGQHLGTL